MAMTPDNIRQQLRQQLEAKGVDLATASKALGRNHAYLHQFVTRGKPAYLHEQDRRALANLYHIDVDRLMPPVRKSVERQAAASGVPRPGDPIRDFSEAAVVAVWRGLPEEDHQVFLGVLNTFAHRRRIPPVAV